MKGSTKHALLIGLFLHVATKYVNSKDHDKHIVVKPLEENEWNKHGYSYLEDFFYFKGRGPHPQHLYTDACTILSYISGAKLWNILVFCGSNTPEGLNSVAERYAKFIMDIKTHKGIICWHPHGDETCIKKAKRILKVDSISSNVSVEDYYNSNIVRISNHSVV